MHGSSENVARAGDDLTTSTGSRYALHDDVVSHRSWWRVPFAGIGITLLRPSFLVGFAELPQHPAAAVGHTVNSTSDEVYGCARTSCPRGRWVDV